MSIMQWTYTPILQIVSSSGSVIVGCTPANVVRIGPPTYEPRGIDYELIDYSPRFSPIGYVAMLEIEFAAPQLADIVSVGTASAPNNYGIASLLKYYVNDAYWKVSLDNGVSFKAMDMLGSVESLGLSDKNVGTGLVLKFRGRVTQPASTSHHSNAYGYPNPTSVGW